MTLAERFRPGVTVVLHPNTREIGRLMRGGARGVGGMVLATVRSQPLSREPI